MGNAQNLIHCRNVKFAEGAIPEFIAYGKYPETAMLKMGSLTQTLNLPKA
jgi:hypothetical protein